LIINKINFTKDAENDIRESVIWYNNQQKDLGQKFIEEVEKLTNRMLENPFTFPKVLKSIHISQSPEIHSQSKSHKIPIHPVLCDF
jgi:hypothetical protein